MREDVDVLLATMLQDANMGAGESYPSYLLSESLRVISYPSHLIEVNVSGGGY